jgi:hypothetical protein
MTNKKATTILVVAPQVDGLLASLIFFDATHPICSTAVSTKSGSRRDAKPDSNSMFKSFIIFVYVLFFTLYSIA